MSKHSSIHQYLSIEKSFLLEHRCTRLSPLTCYHYHDGCEFYLFLQGTATMYVESHAYNLKRGDLFLFRPDELHRVFCLNEDTYERCTLHLQTSYLKQLSTTQTDLLKFCKNPPLAGNCKRHLSEPELQQFLNLFQQIETHQKSTSYGDDILAVTELVRLLINVNLIFEKNGRQAENQMPTLIQKTMDYVESHLTEDISLEHLSKVLFHSGAYISRKFKEHTGITLRDYIICKRILLAKSLLSQNLPLTFVCEQSGFHDYANFNRTFTKQIGCSSGKYRKNLGIIKDV